MDSMTVHYVDTAAGLDHRLESLARAANVAVDTEFVRERTYYPRLCLIQLAVEDAIWCVDPIALGDLTALYQALAAPGCVKAFHAARQDLEIFFNEHGEVPMPLFDTQIAAALLGRPDQIAYAGLVAELCGVELDKSSSRTDWSRRPLSTRQLAYAADDVRYLGDLQRRLEHELAERGRKDWFDEECQRLTEHKLYAAEPTDAWQRLKGTDKLSEPEFARAVALAEWRETTAKARDLPRDWVLKDDRLLALSRNAPRTMSTLGETPGVAPGLVRRYGETLLELLNSPASHENSPPPPKPRLNVAGKKLLQRLLDELRELCEQQGISMSLVATRRELEMAVGQHPDIRLYEGWRETLFGAYVRAEVEARGAGALCD
jgi:ribonuclease D